ncbi:MAG TPA: signal peptidase I, partial [Pseudomonadales bacterium]|nr:signal peptidase I [Pseudomonadales bacterium]
KRGDVMVFRYPQNPSVNYIKRVIGVPGDTVRYENKKLYINDKEMTQKLMANSPGEEIRLENLSGVEHRIRLEPMNRRFRQTEEWIIPEGSYFMMGDNRDNSNDSRFWGMVPEQNIVGKAFAVWMHWRGLTTLPNFSRNGTIH